MYLWVIIATFIAALAALGTSLRPDINHLYVEPQAQTIVTKIYTQHQGMVKYAYKNNSNGENNRASFTQGEWKPSDHKGYLPYGFKANSGVARFTSKIYCLDKDSPTRSSLPSSCMDMSDPENPTESTTENCCAASGVSVYLVTFGRVPQKWKNVRTGKPSSALLNAMKDSLGYINGFGYVIDSASYQDNEGGNKYNTLGTEKGILGQGTRPYYSIPEYIINDSDFQNVCGANNYCLIYMSSI